MDEVALQLKHVEEESEVGTEDLDQFDEVELYSKYYGQSFTVEITHKHGNKFGGDIVKTSVKDPMLGNREIVHFKPEHVQAVKK